MTKQTRATLKLKTPPLPKMKRNWPPAQLLFTDRKILKTSWTRSIFSVELFDEVDIGQDDVPVRFTMGTTTALSRQAVINGAAIKPTKLEADGFHWLEGWPSRCFGKTTPFHLLFGHPLKTGRARCPHYSTLSNLLIIRPVNIFLSTSTHSRPFTFSVSQIYVMFANNIYYYKENLLSFE